MAYPERWTQEVFEALAGEFPPEEVEFLPRGTSGGMALGLPYIDARDVMRRLDAVVGPAGWSFDFDVLGPEAKRVKGRLTVLGVTKCDAGEASGEEEPLKSAVSDALKRCAVHFGVGRYLYYLPRLWAPYDAQKRRFVEKPRLERAAVQRALELCRASGAAGTPGEVPARAAEESSSGAMSPTGPRGVSREGRMGRGAGSDRQATVPESTGDQAAARAGAPGRGRGVPGEACAAAGCGRAITPGQREVSMRAAGEPLCAICMRGRLSPARGQGSAPSA